MDDRPARRRDVDVVDAGRGAPNGVIGDRDAEPTVEGQSCRHVVSDVDLVDVDPDHRLPASTRWDRLCIDVRTLMNKESPGLRRDEPVPGAARNDHRSDREGVGYDMLTLR